MWIGCPVEDVFARAWEQLTGRITGPMWIRLLLQPTVGVGLGVRAGLRDAAAHRRAYLAAFVTTASARRALLRDMWKDVARLCVVAFTVDAVYQLAVLQWFYPLQALVVMGLLAIAPYLLVRGPVTRIARRVRPTHLATILVGVLLLGDLAPALADVPKYGVKVKVNKHFDFRSLKTYCWTTGWRAYDDALHRAIVFAVDRELAARGLLERAAEPCDVVANYASLQRTDIDLDTRAAPGSKLRRQYDVGTLVVLLKRPQSGIELFRARIDTPLEADRSRREGQVDAAIVKMFEDYPIAKVGHRD
jgi:Domain of unknown function (DUF4136)